MLAGRRARAVSRSCATAVRIVGDCSRSLCRWTLDTGHWTHRLTRWPPPGFQHSWCSAGPRPHEIPRKPFVGARVGRQAPVTRTIPTGCRLRRAKRMAGFAGGVVWRKTAENAVLYAKKRATFRREAWDRSRPTEANRGAETAIQRAEIRLRGPRRNAGFAVLSGICDLHV